MKSRHVKLLLLLLPLFVARSLLPIGFMMSFEEGTPRIVFCPSQIAAPNKGAGAGEHELHLAHHGHEHHQSTDQSDAPSVEQSHQTCPFAFAAAAPLSAAMVFAPEPPSSEVVASPPDSAILTLAIRAHPIRGPPALS